MYFSKEDLEFFYKWNTPEHDPKLKGSPDYSIFDRQQGWEVLYLINQFGKKNGAEVKVIGHKAERLIRKHLPPTAYTQKNVMEWLEINWSRY